MLLWKFPPSDPLSLNPLSIKTLMSFSCLLNSKNSNPRKETNEEEEEGGAVAAVSIHHFAAQRITCDAWSPDQASKYLLSSPLSIFLDLVSLCLDSPYVLIGLGIGRFS